MRVNKTKDKKRLNEMRNKKRQDMVGGENEKVKTQEDKRQMTRRDKRLEEVGEKTRRQE